MNYELIGICGNLGSGKNYISEKILYPNLPKKNTIFMAFADHFKIDACITYGVEYSKVFHNKDYKSRQLLQKLGSDGRGKDINWWVNLTDTWMKVYNERGMQRFIITDVRYPNEVKWLKSKGGILIKIQAPKRTLKKLKEENNNDYEKIKKTINHESERLINESEISNQIDYIIDNDKNNVLEQVKEIIEKINLKRN